MFLNLYFLFVFCYVIVSEVFVEIDWKGDEEILVEKFIFWVLVIIFGIIDCFVEYVKVYL